MRSLFALICFIGIASAVTVCQSTSLDYSLLSYSNIDNCFVGSGFSQAFDIQASHQVLALNSRSGEWSYRSIIDLAVGDVVQSAFGTTTVTGVSLTTIASPFIALGQVFNEDTYTNNVFSPYAVTPLLRWVSLDGSTDVEQVKPITTAGYSGSTYTINYWVPSLEEMPINVALGVFDSGNVQDIGSFSCNGTTSEFYYYDPALLMRPLCLDTLYRSFRMMSIADYFGMLQYALSQTNGVFYDGNNIIYDYTLNVPSCDAVSITTADGHLVVNGLVLS